MSGQLAPIPAEEAEQLEAREATIAKGLRNFVTVGTALMTVRDLRLYRATHSTFAGYCKERWGMAKSQAYRVIESAQIVGILPIKAGEAPIIEVTADEENLSPTGDIPKTVPAPESERSIRPLSQIPKEQVADTYQRAVEIAGGEAPTAAQTQQAADERNKLANAMGYKTPEEAVKNIENPVPSDGMRLARIAIKRLEDIKGNDTQREDAMDYVVEWIARFR